MLIWCGNTDFQNNNSAYGTAVTGNYTGADGVANLLTGDYTLADGTSGNIYGSSSSPSKPDTATLTVPTQYTAAGIGSAIPLSALGEWYVRFRSLTCLFWKTVLFTTYSSQAKRSRNS